MQTFLPYPDFERSAQCLDYRRLGKQRVEAFQILQAITDPSYGWQNHPAVNMWRGYQFALADYGLAICSDWIIRGYRDSMYDRILAFAAGDHRAIEMPWWFGDDRFHSEHRAALLFKDQYYSQFDWVEEPKLDYWWPV